VEVRGRVAAAIVAALGLVGLPRLARADEPGGSGGADRGPPGALEDARKHYQRGVQLYGEGADEAALAELQRAYDLAPNWKVLYDVGLVELQLHDFVGALRAFQRYLEGGGDAIAAARRADVTAKIAQLQGEVASIDARAEDGATILLDDVPIGAAPLPAPLVVNPGRHRVGATKEGRVAEARAISVAGGDRQQVEVVLPSIAAPPALPPAPEPAPVTPPAPQAAPLAPPAEAAPPADRPPLWIGWLATGALATGAIVMGVDAVHTSAELSDAKSTATAGSRLDELASRAHGLAIASDVLTGAALVAGGTTLYFAMRARSGPVTVAVGANGVVASGTF
jgi:hypothetical protein